MRRNKLFNHVSFKLDRSHDLFHNFSYILNNYGYITNQRDEKLSATRTIKSDEDRWKVPDELLRGLNLGK